MVATAYESCEKHSVAWFITVFLFGNFQSYIGPGRGHLGFAVPFDCSAGLARVLTGNDLLTVRAVLTIEQKNERSCKNV